MKSKSPSLLRSIISIAFHKPLVFSRLYKSVSLSNPLPLLSLFSKSDLLVIRPSDFPYFISEYIVHMIIWINPILNHSIDDEVIIAYLKLKGYRNFILFENIMINRSVPNIRHYHFFITINDVFVN